MHEVGFSTPNSFCPLLRSANLATALQDIAQYVELPACCLDFAPAQVLYTSATLYYKITASALCREAFLRWYYQLP